MDPTVAFEYDREENIVFAEDHGEIQTPEEADAFFDQYETYLNRVGKKVYMVVNIDHLLVRSAVSAYYGAQARERVVQHILGFARWGTDTWARLTVNTSSGKGKIPTNIFETREQAIEYIEKIKAGTADG